MLDLQLIKKILRKNSQVCIIVEDGKPLYVLTSFAEYQKLLDQQTSNQELDQVNQDLSILRNATELDSRPIEETKELTIENLPLED